MRSRGYVFSTFKRLHAKSDPIACQICQASSHSLSAAFAAGAAGCAAIAACCAAAAAGCADLLALSVGLPVLGRQWGLDVKPHFEQLPGGVDHLDLTVLDLLVCQVVGELASEHEIPAIPIRVAHDVLEVTCISISSVHASGMGRPLHPGCKKSGLYRYARTAKSLETDSCFSRFRKKTKCPRSSTRCELLENEDKHLFKYWICPPNRAANRYEGLPTCTPLFFAQGSHESAHNAKVLRKAVFTAIPNQLNPV